MFQVSRFQALMQFSICNSEDLEFGNFLGAENEGVSQFNSTLSSVILFPSQCRTKKGLSVH